jgi:hypothetical protein
MRLFSRADYARLARVTAAAITKAAAKWPTDAFVSGRINIDAPAPRAYLTTRGVTEKQIASAAAAPTAGAKPRPARERRPTGRRPGPPKQAPRAPARRLVPPQAPAPAPPPLPTIAAPEDIQELQELRDLLSPLLKRFGTQRNFVDWLDALKKIEEILAKHLGNEETEGRLISRDLVQTSVFGAVGAMTRKLLRDSPKTIARKVYALHGAGRPIEEAEAVIRENLTAQFAPMKEQAARALRNA